MYFQIAVKKVDNFFVITIFTCDNKIAYQLFDNLVAIRDPVYFNSDPGLQLLTSNDHC